MEEKTRTELLDEIRSLHQRLNEIHNVYREVEIGLCYLDRDLRYIQINNWLAAFNGQSVEEHIGRKVREVLPKATHIESQLLGVLKSGKPVINETIFFETPLNPGNKMLYQHSFFPNRSEDGTILGISCIVENITELKRNEKKILETEERYNLAINAIPDGIWDWDMIKNSEYFSPNCYEILDYHDSSDLGCCGLMSRIHQDDFKLLAKAILDHFDEKNAFNKNAFNVDCRFRVKSKYRWLNIMGQAVFNEDGNPIRMVSSIRDITERKTAEEKHFQLKARLEQAQRFESFGRLAGSIAHDYRNFLCGLLLTLPDQISKLKEGDPFRDYLILLLKATERTDNFTKEMLNSLQPKGITKLVIRLKNIIEPIVAQMQNLAGDGIKVLSEIDESCVVLADKSRFEQLVINLVKNAIEAITIGKTGTITIKAERVLGNRVRFSVSDTGTGIKEEIKGHIYDPFFTTKPLGTGLGLTNIFQTVKMHDWEIDVENKTSLGHGATFTIFMPLSQSPVKVTFASPPKEFVRTVSHATILVIDDEEMIREGYLTVLKNEGYVVHTASSGQEGIKKFDKILPDLVILDLGMLDMSGLEATRRIISKHLKARILFVSGYQGKIKNLEKNGAINSILKPFTPADLRCKVKEILQFGIIVA